MNRALKIIALVVASIPVLVLASCAYLWSSPHLRFDPITSALMDAPTDREHSWRTADVALMPRFLEAGSPQDQVISRLEAGGYKLFADYSSDVGPTDPYPGDDMSQDELDKFFLDLKQQFNAEGITHVFERGGRIRSGCGESFFIDAGFTAAHLTRATGYSRWTCM